MIFFIDLGFLAIIMLMFGVGVAGSVGTWILEHQTIVAVCLLIKSLLFIGPGLRAKKQHPAYYGIIIATILLDAVKNGVFLYIVVIGLNGMFSGGLFAFFMGILNLLIGGGLALVAAEGPMWPVYMLLWEAPGASPSDKEKSTDGSFLAFLAAVCIGLELLSIVLLWLISLKM